MADKINDNFDDKDFLEDLDDDIEEETESTQMYSSYDNQVESEDEYQESDEQEYADSNEEEYDDSNEEYDDSDEEYDENSDESNSSSKKQKQLLALIIFIVIAGLLALLAIPKLMGNKSSNVVNNTSVNNAEVQQDVNSNPAEENFADSFFDAANNENGGMIGVDFNENGDVNVSDGEGEDQNENANVATVSEPESSDDGLTDDLFGNGEQSASEGNNENNAIMVVYNKAARINPFKPPVVSSSESIPYDVINNTKFEIIEPPTTSVPDENLSRLLQTQISGILYDEESPSAIVNLNGIDQFVKVGDVVSGYKIIQITNDKVQIEYKNNSYVASVGELFTRGSLEKQSAVVNLNNKFAGRYKNNN